MRKELADYISELLLRTEVANLILEDEKEISYGVQLLFTNGKNQIPLNIYYSPKKGISTVVGGKDDNPLKEKLNYLLSTAGKQKVSYNVWAGTDESGKGDFFGPLVVSGVVLDKQKFELLAKLGIKDSKLLTDKKIIALIPRLYKILNGSFDTIVLNPEKYNQLYEKFSKQGKKLNELLAWMHGKVIVNLTEKYKIETVIVDKFANEKVLKNSLTQLKAVNIIQRVRAEDDLAVACASILSRYHFVMRMDALSNKYDIHLPKGAGGKVKIAAAKFSQVFGKERLREVAKVHFKTYNEIEV